MFVSMRAVDENENENSKGSSVGTVLTKCSIITGLIYDKKYIK